MTPFINSSSQSIFHMSTQSQFIQPMTDNEYAQLKDLYANNGVSKIININVSRQLSSLYLVETRFENKLEQCNVLCH